jgi:plasmid maintenance system antidote protein VapI
MTTKLKTAMEGKGLTQSELARRSGIDKYRINTFVNGCARLGEKTAGRLAIVLGCKPSDLREVAQ